MPANAIYVGRPTAYGNPFRITRSSDYHGLPGSWFVMDDTGMVYHPNEDTESSARQKAVDLFSERLFEHPDRGLIEALIRAELAGRNIACWCPIKQPCHADVLLRIANAHPALRAPKGLPCPECGQFFLEVKCILNRAGAHVLDKPIVTCNKCTRNITGHTS